MNKHDQNGSISGVLLSLIFVSLLFVASSSFAAWAYTSRQDYKNNTDEKIASAVKLARIDEATLKDKQFVEVSKQPLRTYSGPQAYGSLVVKYPKTWSAYIDSSGRGATPVDGYYYPGVVPAITDQSSNYALRTQVLTQSYSAVLASIANLQKTGKISVEPYSLPLVPGAVGVRIEGEIKPSVNGVMVILPLRDKTVEIATEGTEFRGDFDTNILPNLTFAP